MPSSSLAPAVIFISKDDKIILLKYHFVLRRRAMSGLVHAIDVAGDQMEAMGFGGRQMMKFVRCVLQKIFAPNCLPTPILP